MLYLIKVLILSDKFINSWLTPLINIFGVFFMEQQQSRPLDALNAARHKRVIVDLKNGRQFIGELEAFDIHINLVLEDAEQRYDGQTEKKIGKVFLRGDTIISINVSEQ